jgi:hypothetical protein
LGQPLAEAREQRLAVAIHVQGSDQSFAAKLSFAGPQGTEQRFLEHPECAKLTEAAALLVALAIDPERVKSRQQAEGSTESAAVVPEDPRPAAPVEPVAALPAPPLARQRAHGSVERPRPAVRATMTLAAIAGRGPLPELSTGVAGELGARYRLFRAAAVGRYWLPGDADVEGFAGSSVRLSLATLGARACGVPGSGAWAVLACVGGDFGSLSGTGQGVGNARTRSELFAAAAASASVAYTHSELSPLVGLEFSGALNRPRFGVLQGGIEHQAFRPSQWMLLGSFGVALGL